MVLKPWERFRVGPQSTRLNWTEPSCRPLTTVAHVAHVPTARRIIEDTSLHADLVFDKSKLDTERIRVVWLSPNDWAGAGGFRYGNVRFQLDWPNLVHDKQAYWVESIDYRIDACRILITDSDRSDTLERYDPATAGGPWRLSGPDHYWNGNYCLEVMYEGDIPLSLVEGVDFVDHHPDRCSVDYRTCAYRGKPGRKGGAEFLAGLLSQAPIISVPGLVEDKGRGPEPSAALESAACQILTSAAFGVSSWGALVASAACAPATARAVLGAIGNPRISTERATLAGFFQNADELATALSDVIAAGVGLPSGSVFLT